jgi:hypothetical protein
MVVAGFRVEVCECCERSVLKCCVRVAGGVRGRPHAVPAAVRAGDGDGGARSACAARRRARASSPARAHHARAASGALSFILPISLYTRRGNRDISDILRNTQFYQRIIAMGNTADVAGGKPIAV